MLSDEQKKLLAEPLPPEAISPHPTKKYLSTINPIFVVERLNEVFGVGRWHTQTEVIESTDKMKVVKLTFTVADDDIHIEQFGGNDNPDAGDAYKGAMTDALTKVGSYLGIGMDVWKDKKKSPERPTQPGRAPIPGEVDPEVAERKRLTKSIEDSLFLLGKTREWIEESVGLPLNDLPLPKLLELERKVQSQLEKGGLSEGGTY